MNKSPSTVQMSKSTKQTQSVDTIIIRVPTDKSIIDSLCGKSMNRQYE